MTDARKELADRMAAQPAASFWHPDGGHGSDPKIFVNVSLSSAERDLMVSALRAPALPSWQPITTAPKDGTAVWLLVENQPYIGAFDPYDAPWSTPRFFVRAVVRRREKIGGVTTDDVSLVQGGEVSPTHWMPLPAPPTEAGGAEKHRPEKI